MSKGTRPANDVDARVSIAKYHLRLALEELDKLPAGDDVDNAICDARAALQWLTP